MPSQVRQFGRRQRENSAVATDNLSTWAAEFIQGNSDYGKKIITEAKQALSIDLPAGKPPRKSFHWPLEFPEVFERGGFDGIVGNPPFMYGKNISGIMGSTYSEYLSNLHHWASKNIDLCVHFYLRSFLLLHNNGKMGLLATKTIAEGDSREGGLEWIISNNGLIFAAFPNELWPGKASVIISRVHIAKGEWKGTLLLYNKEVKFISSYLTDQELWTPSPLKSNKGIAFQGVTVLGEGHFISEEEALALIKKNKKNKNVLFPFINGDELNSDPEQRPSRWVINFFDWRESRAAEYSDVFELLKVRAYPDRFEKSKEKSYNNIMKSWWHHWRNRSDLCHAIGKGSEFEKHPKNWSSDIPQFDQVLVIARTSKTGAFVFMPSNYALSDATVVFARSDYWFFGVLQSNIHICYAWFHSSKLKSDLRYSHSDCFETFPLPAKNDSNQILEKIGKDYHNTRARFLKNYNIGLTEFYHRLHDQEYKQSDIVEIRQLQVLLDENVKKAYEFEDISLNHGFHSVAYLPKNDCARYTICEEARIEILNRLSQLNREYHLRESQRVMQNKATKKNKKRLKIQNETKLQRQKSLF